MKKINGTLLQKLFNSNQTHGMSKNATIMYKKFMYRIFPGKEAFIKFLTADSSDEQYEYADRIIRRICYESNFAPTEEMLHDVLLIEQSKKVGISDINSYISRDHYVHTIYVYMLGIYIFFYNKKIYDSIIERYRNARVNDHYENDIDGCVKDFISAWKYFSIYHDIGYQVEVLSRTNPKYTYNDLKVLKDFSFSLDTDKFFEQFVKMATAKVVSRLLFVKKILSESELISKDNREIRSLRDKTVMMIDGEKTIEINGSELADRLVGLQLMKIDKIKTNQSLKTLIATIGRSSFVIAGRSIQTGKTSFVINCTSDGFEQYELDGCRIPSELRANPEMVLFDEYSSKKFSLIYYVKHNTTANSLVSPTAEIADSLDAALVNISFLMDEEYERITNDEQINEYKYHIYDYISEEAQEMFTNSTLLEQLLADKELEENGISEVSDIIYSCVSEVLSEELESDGTVSMMEKIRERYRICLEKKPKASDINMVIENYADAARQVLTGFSRVDADEMYRVTTMTLREKYLDAMSRKVSTWKLIAYIASRIHGRVMKHNVTYSYNYETQKVEARLIDLDHAMQNNLEAHFGRIAQIDNIVGKYSIPYGNLNDHGIESTLCFYNTFMAYQQMLDNNTEEIDEKIALILFDYSFPIDTLQIRCSQNYDSIIEDVLFSVFIHNITPSEFVVDELSSKRVSMKLPFIYLALICDALQQWNRPHSQSPISFRLRPNNDAGESYDIQVSNDYINVYENTNKRDQKRLNENLDKLNEYMRFSSAYIRNGHMQ